MKRSIENRQYEGYTAKLYQFLMFTNLKMNLLLLIVLELVLFFILIPEGDVSFYNGKNIEMNDANE